MDVLSAGHKISPWLGSIIGVAALISAMPVYSTGVYSFDFDNSMVVAPGVLETLSLGATARTTIRSVQGYTEDGFVGDMLVSNGTGNSATTLTLENLPAQTSINIGFLLATINYGNFCDADFQNDCTINFADREIFAAAFFSNDPLTDLDSDGTIGFFDLALLRQMFFSRPGPSGLTTLCDL